MGRRSGNHPPPLRLHSSPTQSRIETDAVRQLVHHECTTQTIDGLSMVHVTLTISI